MAIINPQIPSLNSSTETEDPKIVDALTVIRDEINGGLDNDNIANGADINGAKMLNASIAAGKLEGSITGALIAAATIGDGNLKFRTQAVSGTSNSGVICSQASVVPGLYLVLAFAEGALGTALGSSGGTATVYDQKSTWDAYTGGGGVGSNRAAHHAIADVAATTTLRLTSTPGGTQAGRFIIFGIET